jgi:5-methyltetrahydrofolate--homocysteine methyltransferase
MTQGPRPIPPVPQTPPAPKRSTIDIPRPTPPFWGTKILNPEDIPLEEVFWLSGSTGAVCGPVAVPQAQGAVAGRVRRLFAGNGASDFGHLESRIQAENLLHPQIVYGYFPCLAEGNSLHIYDPSVVSAIDRRGSQNPKSKIPEPIATFTFPRQKSLRRLCIADFFLPQDQAQPGNLMCSPCRR